MTTYTSVKNTAKNGQLLRSEIREIVLAMAIYHGFYHDKKLAMQYYPEDLHRQKQFTFMVTNEAPYLLEDKNLDKLSKWLIDTMKYFFKYEDIICYEEPFGEDSMFTQFYDTKKFRIYAKRMEYGKRKYTRLDKATMQYFWTKLPLALWYCYAEDEVNNALDFWNFDAMLRPLELEDNMREISRYISEVCGIPNTYDYKKSETRLYFSSEDFAKLKQTCKEEALRIKQKLYNGAYIELTEEEMKDIDTKGYDYGKKSREEYRRINLARKTGKNQTAN